MESYQDELMHYGVPGMKWGVRKNRERAARTGRRIERQQSKLNKAAGKRGKENFLYRNTVGDYRRGQIKRLENIQANQKAKANYLENKNASTKSQLRTSRVNRLTRNSYGKITGNTYGARGAYDRYKKSGNDTTTALLKAGGKMLVTSAAVGATATVGRKLATKYLETKFQ